MGCSWGGSDFGVSSPEERVSVLTCSLAQLSLQEESRGVSSSASRAQRQPLCTPWSDGDGVYSSWGRSTGTGCCSSLPFCLCSRPRGLYRIRSHIIRKTG